MSYMEMTPCPKWRYSGKKGGFLKFNHSHPYLAMVEHLTKNQKTERLALKIRDFQPCAFLDNQTKQDKN